MCLLRVYWDHSKVKFQKPGHFYRGVVQPEEDVDDETNQMLAGASVAISKPWFWSYCHMLLELGEALAHMEHFLLSRPCRQGPAAEEASRD